MIPVEQVVGYVRSRHVRGWLHVTEGRCLYDLAAACDGPILEVGTYMGLSTCYLAAPGRWPVTTVDPHSTAKHNPSQVTMSAGEDTLEAALATWAGLGLDNIDAVKATLAKAVKGGSIGAGFGLVFLDASHHAKDVARDLEEVAALTLPGGTIACHDWGIRGDEAEPWGVALAASGFLEARPDWTLAFRHATLGVLQHHAPEADGGAEL